MFTLQSKSLTPGVLVQILVEDSHCPVRSTAAAAKQQHRQRRRQFVDTNIHSWEYKDHYGAFFATNRLHQFAVDFQTRERDGKGGGSFVIDKRRRQNTFGESRGGANQRGHNL